MKFVVYKKGYEAIPDTSRMTDSVCDKKSKTQPFALWGAVAHLPELRAR